MEQLEKRLTIEEIIKLTGTSRTFIYSQIKRGKLSPPEKLGRSSRWKESDVLQWLNSFEKGLSDSPNPAKK